MRSVLVSQGRTDLPSILDGPELDVVNVPVWEAFWRLSNSRPGLDPIKISEVVCYLDNYESGCDREEFLDLIQAMDLAYRRIIGEKRRG